MQIEITIRFADPIADINAFVEGLQGYFDADVEIRGRVIGGLYFRTERSPADFFKWLAEAYFEMKDFDNIEIKPV